jgi:hypothetical protein
VTGYHLAQLNVGIVRAPIESPELADFMAGIVPVNAIADGAPGFVWRLQDGDGPGATAVRPRGPDFMINMSVWETLEALRDFVYRNGPHLDAMRKRREWFGKMAEQHLVLWWIPAGHLPGIDEALDRLDLLRRHGPGPLAFTFREPCPLDALLIDDQRPGREHPLRGRRIGARVSPWWGPGRA